MIRRATATGTTRPRRPRRRRARTGLAITPTARRITRPIRVVPRKIMAMRPTRPLRPRRTHAFGSRPNAFPGRPNSTHGLRLVVFGQRYIGRGSWHGSSRLCQRVDGREWQQQPRPLGHASAHHLLRRCMPRLGSPIPALGPTYLSPRRAGRGPASFPRAGVPYWGACITVGRRPQPALPWPKRHGRASPPGPSRPAAFFLPMQMVRRPARPAIASWESRINRRRDLSVAVGVSIGMAFGISLGPTRRD